LGGSPETVSQVDRRSIEASVGDIDVDDDSQGPMRVVLPQERHYVLRDAEGEEILSRRLGFPAYSLSAAISRARKSGPLLAGRQVRLLGESSAIPRDSLRTLVIAAGGVWVAEEDCEDRVEIEYDGAGELLVLVDCKAPGWQAAACAARGHPVYDVEAVLTAACTQELALERHRVPESVLCGIGGGRRGGIVMGTGRGPGPLADGQRVRRWARGALAAGCMELPPGAADESGPLGRGSPPGALQSLAAM